MMKVGLRKFCFTLPGAEDQDGDGEGSKTGKSELRAGTGERTPESGGAMFT